MVPFLSRPSQPLLPLLRRSLLPGTGPTCCRPHSHSFPELPSSMEWDGRLERGTPPNQQRTRCLGSCKVRPRR